MVFPVLNECSNCVPKYDLLVNGTKRTLTKASSSTKRRRTVK